MSNKVDSFSFSIIRKSRISSLRLPDGETRRKGARTTKNLWVSKLRCRCGSSYRIFNWRKLKDGTPVFGYQALCKQADDEVARLEQELKALSPAPDPQTVSSDMKEIHDFLSQKFDVHGARLAPELIDRFVEVVTPHCRLLLPLEAEHRLQEVQRGAHRFDGCIGKAHPYLHHRL